MEYEDKWTIVLGLTSNKGSADFQQKRFDDEYLYESVLKKVSTWGTKENLMFVIGATKSDQISSVRKIIPDNFLLVPGVGFQGGSLSHISNAGLTKECGLLVNVSRAIIYAGEDEKFAGKARAIALPYCQDMAKFLS